MSTPADADRLADRIIVALGEPFTINGHEASIGASIGIVSLDGANAGTVLRQADIAMYDAKRSGRSCSVRFDPTKIGTETDRAKTEASPQLR